MTVQFDAFSTYHSDATGSAPSWTHTPAGTPTAVAVTIICGTTPSSVTYGGMALSSAVTISSGSYRSFIYGVSNPPSGTNSVVINLGSTIMIAGAITVTGSNLVKCFTDSSSASGTSPSASLSVNGNAGELLVDLFCYTNSSSVSANPSGTLRWSYGDSTYLFSGMSSTISSTNTSWFRSNSTASWILVAASFSIPASAAQSAVIMAARNRDWSGYRRSPIIRMARGIYCF